MPSIMQRIARLIRPSRKPSENGPITSRSSSPGNDQAGRLRSQVEQIAIVIDEAAKNPHFTWRERQRLRASADELWRTIDHIRNVQHTTFQRERR